MHERLRCTGSNAEEDPDFDGYDADGDGAIRYTDLVGISTVHNIVVEIGDFVQVNRTILWVRTVQDSQYVNIPVKTPTEGYVYAINVEVGQEVTSRLQDLAIVVEDHERFTNLDEYNARDRDGDGKMERKRKSGEFQENLLYDVVHDYIIAENFASDTEGANKVMLKLSDELMQEIYERTMTASEKRKDTMLKKKYDDSDMKKNMQGQYGKEEGKKVYFATIRKQAMKKEEVESVEEKIKYDKSGSSMDYFLGADPKKTEYYKKNAKKKMKKEEVEKEDPSVKAKMKRQAMIKKQVLMKKLQAVRAGAGADITSSHEPEGDMVEAKYEAGASTYGKASIRNKRRFGTKGENPDPLTGKKITKDATRGELITKRREEHKAKRGVKEEVGITTHSMMMKDKAKKEAMLRMKERDAVAKKLRKEERDEYGDPVGGPKISKKEKEKNLKKNTPDEQHTTTTSEGYGSDRVGPALKVARVIDRVNPRPKPNSKRTMVSRALKMASIKKDEKIRKRQENPYSTDKKLKMVATSIRDRVKRKVKSMAANEDYIPEEGYDIARDMGRVRPSKDKKDATTMPPSPEMKKTQKVNKGPSAFERVKKKYGKAVMVVGKK